MLSCWCQSDDRDDLQVALALPNGNSDMAQGEHQFCGNFEHSKDDMDCVLLFDGRSFRMEALAGRINNLRYAWVGSVRLRSKRYAAQ